MNYYQQILKNYNSEKIHKSNIKTLTSFLSKIENIKLINLTDQIILKSATNFIYPCNASNSHFNKMGYEIFSKMIIGANGNINACACRDANFTLSIGSLKNKKISDIISIKNQKYLDLINNQEKGNFPEVCKNCDFYDSIYLKKTNSIDKKVFLDSIS